MFGPYATEKDAIADARDVLDTNPVGRGWEALNATKLIEACESAGVDLGVYDLQMIEWMARWEPQAVQVFVGLITRAGTR